MMVRALRSASRSIPELTGCSAVIPYIFLEQAEWKRLNTLSLGLELYEPYEAITRITEFLTTFHLPSLEDVTAHFLVTGRDGRFQLLGTHTKTATECPKLEEALLTFPRPRLSFFIMAQAKPRKLTWTSGIASLFPVLRDRHLLSIIYDPGELDLCCMTSRERSANNSDSL